MGCLETSVSSPKMPASIRRISEQAERKGPPGWLDYFQTYRSRLGAYPDDMTRWRVSSAKASEAVSRIMSGSGAFP
jgi:hypothetical protein